MKNGHMSKYIVLSNQHGLLYKVMCFYNFILTLSFFLPIKLHYISSVYILTTYVIWV